MTDPSTACDLSGRVALVTGASAGLGRRLALALAQHGAKVIATARRKDRLDELATQIRAAGGTVLPLALDITSRSSIRAALADAEQGFGLIDILVNNAGVPDARRAHKMPDELVDAVFDTNLRGPWILSCEIAARLIAAGRRGDIVNISSMAAFSYDGNGAALYSVTKAGLARMTEALAIEWARNNINVNAIAPGYFMSEMMEGMLERVGDFSKDFPRGRFLDPAVLDQTLLYLLSAGSAGVTGTVIKVDDGQFPR